jgi:hypothetical protein
MRVRGDEWKVKVDPEDFGTLCICAIRYCFGRQTYMPGMVQDIVLSHLKELSDKDIQVLLNDRDFQRTLDLYGDPNIDRPGWLRFWEKVKAEALRRGLKV